MSSKKTTKTATTSSNTPWAPAQPYITDSLEGAKDAANQGQSLITNNQSGINAALSKLSSNVTDRPSYQTDARTQLGKTINGDYINANPYTSGLADLIAQKTGAQYNSTFGAAGRASGGLAALLSAQGTGDALQQFYSNQYNTERGNQMQAIGMAPAFNTDEQTASNALLNGIGVASQQPGQIANNYAATVANATSPYVQNASTGKTTEKTSGLGSVLSTVGGLAAQLGGAFLPTGGMSGLLGGTAALGPTASLATGAMTDRINGGLSAQLAGRNFLG